MASGSLRLAQISGDYQLDIDSFSAGASSLRAVSGSYARNDNLPGLSRLQDSEDGSVQFTGSCEGAGSVATIDEQVNLYRL